MTTDDRRAKIEAAVRAWTAQLVDVSGRNNLLFYRDLRQGTLDLSAGAGADAAAVEKLLAGTTVRLSALFPADVLPAAAKRGRTLRAKAKENFEERGLRTLFVGWAMATWTNERGTATPAAPILLYPATLTARGGAAEDFDVQLDPEPEINPTLLHLLATRFAVRLDAAALDELLEPLPERVPAPEPAPGTAPTEPPAPRGPMAVVDALRAAGAAVPGFTISGRVILGNFSYAKLPMVRDLESAVNALTEHDLIAAIAGDEAAREAVRTRRPVVDVTGPDRAAPSAEFLVLDTDASQNAVINTVLAGGDLVVEGPPGTGKSQTISNLIATLVASGQRVLFVAEKRAAIDAVLNRLHRVGLGEVVLDLHDGAGSRRQLAQDLAKTLADAASIPLPDRANADDTLVRRREAAAGYAAALHGHRHPWGVSVYEVQNGILEIVEANRSAVRFRGPALEALAGDAYRQTVDEVRTFATLGGPAIASGGSPWSAALRAGGVARPEDAQTARDLASSVRSQTLPAAHHAYEAALAETGLARPPTIDAWDQVLALFAAVASSDAAFDPSVFELDLDALVTSFAPAGSGWFSRAVASMFRGSYRNARSSLRKVARSKQSTRDLYEHARAAADARRSWAALGGTGAPRRPADAAAVTSAHTALQAQLAPLGSYTGQALAAVDVAVLAAHLDALLADQATLMKLPELHRVLGALEGRGLAEVVAELSASGGGADVAVTRFEHAWRASVLDAIAFVDPRIGAFDANAQRATVAEFRQRDVDQISAAAQRVRRACAERATAVRDRFPGESDLIEHQARLKRRHMAVRDLFTKAPNVLGALKPCWAMSPLVVAQLLPAEPCFDVVVFDEASQITPADAVSSLLRGRRAVVAGDAKQLPPTSFFVSAPTESDASDQPDVDDVALTHDLESLLDVMGALLPPPDGTRTLGWHYRSRDERLIAFSNAQPNLYDWRLTTFPGTTGARCLRHVLSSSVPAEADEVVALILDHARNRPAQSLGVIAMGIEHAERIEEALRRARADAPDVDAFFDEGAKEPFFVKNLERVQGDERDAILLSIGYGKDETGKLAYRFGPINIEGGERRLNVAITRARSTMTVVSSFVAADMDPDRLRAEGAKMLRRYLAYAESGGADLGTAARPRTEPDALLRDVVAVLSEAGVPVEPQFGASAVAIDVACPHPTEDGRYVLAIETDGPVYAAGATARDRDRLRIEHLGRLGWAHHRLWSTSWLRDRAGEVARAVEAYRGAIDWSEAPPLSAAAPVAPTPAPASTGAPARGDRPRVGRHHDIDDYSHNQLVSLVRWIESDTLLRTTDELRDEMVQELGFSRRGPRIVAAIDAAIADARA